jgi:uncharacterized membrane protein YphA (DoxX/SURF4 family)
VFAASGTAKITMPRERLLATGQTGVAMFPMPVVRFTAAMELLAAVGLVAPRLTGVGQVLTPLAAAGLCVVMVGAAWAHSRLHEPGQRRAERRAVRRGSVRRDRAAALKTPEALGPADPSRLRPALR